MKQSSIIVLNNLLMQLRQLIPKGRMSYGQARIVAQQQALRVRKLLGNTPARLSLDFIECIPGVSVTMLTPAEMEKLTKRPNASGATDVRKDGTYRIFINENNSITHCRFTLAHEFAHVITGPFADEVFADFGYGDSDLHADRVERVADHFAANLLMPASLVKHAWGIPIQGMSELAGLFGVSEEAMRIRLKTIGLIRSGLTKRMFYRQPRVASPDRLATERIKRHVCRRAGHVDQTLLLRDWFKPPHKLKGGVRLFFRSVAAAGAGDPRSQHDYQEMRCPGKVLTVAEACARLRISRWMLYRLIHERQLKTFKLGSRRLILESALSALIDQLSDQEAA